MNIKYYLLLLISAVILSFFLYGNSLNGDFVYDDSFFTVRSELREPSHLVKVWGEPVLPSNVLSGLFRPLSVFTININYILFGESPVSFHMVNIVLNGIVTFLVFILVKKLFNNSILALFVSIFFAFLPIHTEVVANIKNRDEILSSLFALTSWILFLQASEKVGKLRMILAITSAVSYVLAVLSKEFMIVLPALILIVFYLKEKPKPSLFVKSLVIFAISSALYMVWRFRVLGEYSMGNDVLFFAINPLENADFWVRIWTSFKLAFIYIGKTFIPWNLSASYHYNQVTLVSNPFLSLQALLGIVLLAILVLLVVFRKTRNTALGIGALTFLISYSIFSKFIFKGGDFFAERWMYFPSLGLSLIGGFVIYLLYKRNKWLGSIFLAIVLMVYLSVLVPRNLVWQSSESLYKSMIISAPNSVMGHEGLAREYNLQGRLKEAEREASIALKIAPDYPPLLNTIGKIEYNKGNLQLAEHYYIKATEIAPLVADGYQNASKLYFKLGKYKEAEKALEVLVEGGGRPVDVDVVDYAHVLTILGKYQKSLDVINTYYTGDFIDSRLKLILGVNNYRLRKMDEANKYFDWDLETSEGEKMRIVNDSENGLK